MEIINKSRNVTCKNCSGTGILRTKRDENNLCPDCPMCNGTGVYENESFILVAEQPDGQKIAFQCNQRGK